MAAIELNRLCVFGRLEPVEESPAAAAHGGSAAPEWRPHRTRARPDVCSTDGRLPFLTNAAAHREGLRRTEIVLHVDAQLRLDRSQKRIAGVAGIRGRSAGGEGLKAGERERTAGISVLVPAVSGRFQQQPGADCMSSDGDVEIIGHFQLAAAPGSVDLRAAGVERVQHEDRRGCRSRLVRDVLLTPLDAQLIEHRLPDRTSD